MKTILLLSTLTAFFAIGQDRIEGTYDSKKGVFTFANGSRTVRDFRYGVAPYEDYHAELTGVIDTTGRIILKPTYYEIEGFGGGISRVTKKEEPWELTYGFIDTTGKEILPPIYDDADEWFYRSMRFAEVLVVGKDGNYGIFDYSGKKLTPLKYQSIWEFHGGLVRVLKDGKWGFVNKEGKEVIPTQYEEAKDFSANMALVKKNGKYGWIDTEGKTVIPFEYEWAQGFLSGWAKVKKDGKMIFIDMKGNPKLPDEYDGVGYYSEGLAWARKGEKWGFIDSLGNVVIPLEYKKVGNFQRGRAWVWSVDGKWGHIDRTGKVTTPIIYERASDFSTQYTGDSLFAGVQLNGKYGKVGINGNLVIPCEYIGIDHYSHGLAKAKKQVGDKNKFGYLDYSGKEVIPFIYDKAEPFSKTNGVAIVEKDGKKGMINTKREFVVELKLQSIYDKRDGTYEVNEGGNRYVIDATGKRIEK